MTGKDVTRRMTRPMLALAAGAVCAVLTAACSSSSSSSSSTAATTAPASSAPATSAPATPASSAPATPASSAPATPASSAPATSAAATKAAITANWTTFFDPKASLAKRVAVLENGSQLTPAVQGLSNSPTSKTSSAKVVSVSVLSATTAKVIYNVLLSGTPVLTNQAGSAVLQDGAWKVSTVSFCGLLSLDGVKPLPAACKA